MSPGAALLDPVVAGLIERAAAVARPPLETLDAWQVQALLGETLRASAVPRRTDLARVETFCISRADGGQLPLRLYAPRAFDGDAPRPVMLFFHGGGFMLGDLVTHDALAADIAAALDLVVVAVDYRLAPQHRFPAAVEDVCGAMQWACGQPPQIGHGVSGLVLGGDSAGGMLSAVGAQFSGSFGLPVLVQWLMYATVEPNATGGSIDAFSEGYLLTGRMMAIFRDAYYGTADRTHAHAAPLFHDQPWLLPPAMVFACGFDPLRDQARAYAARLIAHGVAVRYREGLGLVHGAFTQRHLVPAAQAHFLGCVADVRSLMEQRLSELGIAVPASA